MKALALDASIALAWCYPDEQSAYADTVLHELSTAVAFVPAIWTLEIANSVVTGLRRKRLELAQAERFRRLVNSLYVTPVELDIRTTFGLVVPLAAKCGLTVYDAAYLETAMRNGIPLATLDKRMREAARVVGVRLFEA